MIIKFLRLQNFRCFRGQHELEFMPSFPGKAITLVGGDNGKGKTTLLNAIKLCLYGRRCPGLWEQGLNNYRQFIVENFNNTAFRRGERELRIELGLAVLENKIERELVIRRSYYVTDSRLFLSDSQEELEVIRDGRPIDLVQARQGYDPEDGYEQLLRLLIPPNFAQFYFFDGEHVRDVFRHLEASNISQAIRDLLGLSFFERLLDDLRQYRRSKLPSIYGKHQQKTGLLLTKQGERDQALGKITALQGQVDDYGEQLLECESKLEDKEKSFAKLGGLHQAEAEALKEKEREAELEYERVSRTLKGALGGDFAVAFLLPLERQWRERTASERARRKWLAKRDAIEPQISVLNEHIFGPSALQPDVPLSHVQAEFFRGRLADEVRKLFWPPPPEASDALWLDLRDHEISHIENQFASAASFSAQVIKELTDAKARADAIRGRVRERLGSISSSEVVASTQRELNDLREEKGRLRAKIEETQNAILHERSQLERIEAEITVLSRECEKSSRGQQKEELSKLYEKAVNEYIGKAAAEKADEIESYLNSLFLAMANSRNFIKEVKLDRRTYGLNVYDANGRERPIESALSAGQSQVLAMSFVAALAKASGRVLPFIVDTPLGRLDVDHRRDVTEHFFMKCDPQIILLSTPTEINNCVYDNVQLDLLDTLRPKVARAYTLVQGDPEETVIEQGYFGNDIS